MLRISVSEQTPSCRIIKLEATLPDDPHLLTFAIGDPNAELVRLVEHRTYWDMIGLVAELTA